MYFLKIKVGRVERLEEFQKVSEAKEGYKKLKSCLQKNLFENSIPYVKVSLLKNCHEIGWIVWESNGIGDLIVRSWADSSFNTNWVK